MTRPHRRRFLAASALTAFGWAGCGRPAAGPPDADRQRIDRERAERARHLALLEKFRVPPAATRTTLAPPSDVLNAAPELKGLAKVTVRLHPRFSAEPRPDDSKIGGRFLWPADEPWPTCDAHGIPLAAVVQLRADDAPPNLAFRPGTDLLQLLWCPRDHDGGRVKPAAFWRKRAAVPPAEPPASDLAFPGYVPVPCRVFPERVTEFPPSALLPESVRGKVLALANYDDLLAACPGTKVGGYPWGATKADKTACDRCGWPMDFLLGVSGSEWGDPTWKRWMPAEEQPGRSPESDEGLGRAAGLALDRPVNVFVCRRCEEWPVVG